MTLTIDPIAALDGTVRTPSDKSLTHRAAMLAAIADGPCVVRRPLLGEDCESTRKCLESMGMVSEIIEDGYRFTPAPEWTSPTEPLNCGNSGTTMRLLSGLLAGRPLEGVLIGDASLSKRPMGRIADPLRLMGATVEPVLPMEGTFRPPIRVRGTTSLKGIDYRTPVASAQIKSCVLLAGLRASGKTRVAEPAPSRDHTERMLRATGVHVSQGEWIEVAGGGVPQAFEFTVPADISSAAFLMVAAAISPRGRVILPEVGLNPTRTGILDVFDQCGIPLVVGDTHEELGEPMGTLEVRSSTTYRPFVIEGSMVPRLIDEIPVLAVLATQCEGTSIIRDARELRVKESDRIETVATALRRMGAVVETFEDGLAVTGPVRLKAARIDAHGDHRIAMAFAVAGLIADGSTVIDGADSILTSFPGFEDAIRSLTIV